MDEVESFNDALIECVKAAGGSKVVGPKLFPEKSVNDAQRLLLACLNDDRPEKLSPDQALLILRMAREVGNHNGIEFLCSTLSYSIPTPIEPKDESAQLQREYIDSVRTMGKLADRLEYLQSKISK
jgi:hypothetical protein